MERLASFVSSRTGATYPLFRPVPEYSLNPFYWLGALSVVAFVIQGVTGVIMMIYYIPTPGFMPTPTTLYIFQSVNYGRVPRDGPPLHGVRDDHARLHAHDEGLLRLRPQEAARANVDNGDGDGVRHARLRVHRLPSSLDGRLQVGDRRRDRDDERAPDAHRQPRKLPGGRDGGRPPPSSCASTTSTSSCSPRCSWSSWRSRCTCSRPTGSPSRSPGR